MKRKYGRKSATVLAGQLDMFAAIPERVELHSGTRSPSSILPPQLKRAPVTKRAQKLDTQTYSATTARTPSSILRVQDAAVRVGLSVSTLNKMRCDGRGPRFIKLTGKVVGYAVEDLDAWVEKRRMAAGTVHSK